MTPESNEDLVRWALHTSASSRQEHYAALEALVAERDEYQEEVFRLASLNDGLVAERDRLAAQLAAAERERDEALHAEDVAERYREAAEARVAALTEALREIADEADTGYGVSPEYHGLAEHHAAIARAALAAADRPEGTTP